MLEKRSTLLLFQLDNEVAEIQKVRNAPMYQPPHYVAFSHCLLACLIIPQKEVETIYLCGSLHYCAQYSLHHIVVQCLHQGYSMLLQCFSLSHGRQQSSCMLALAKKIHVSIVKQQNNSLPTRMTDTPHCFISLLKVSE